MEGEKLLLSSGVDSKGLPRPLETQMGEEAFPRVESEGARL